MWKHEITKSDLFLFLQIAQLFVKWQYSLKQKTKLTCSGDACSPEEKVMTFWLKLTNWWYNPWLTANVTVTVLWIMYYDVLQSPFSFKKKY